MVTYTTYNCDALTGGTERALDSISVSALSDKERAIVAVGAEFSYFVYNTAGTAAENTSTHPYVVRPDDFSTAGNWEEFEVLGGAVAMSLFDAQSILAAVSDDTPVAVTVAEQTLVGRMTSGDIDDLSATQVRTLINVEDGAEANNLSDENATDLTDGGDTNLHDHDGISENTTSRHTQDTDTALGDVGTKNPPIDADKVVCRDSTDSDALVTSTWAQIKAFLKTYFDTLYNKYVHPNHSGDVTSDADGAQTIAANAVTYAKMQNVSATDKLLGRETAGAGDIEEIACTAAGRTLIAHATADDLVDNSMADTLHRHSELSASDGTPDAIVGVDADGNAIFNYWTNIIGTYGFRCFGVGVPGDADYEYLQFAHQGASGASLNVYKGGTGTYRSFKILTSNTTRFELTAAGDLGIGNVVPTAMLDINSDIMRLRTAKTPASAGAAGNAGDICWDANNIYVCVATNTWKKAGIATW